MEKSELEARLALIRMDLEGDDGSWRGELLPALAYVEPEEVWESQKEWVFEVVAIIESPAEQIHLAFLAGHCLARGIPLAFLPGEEEVSPSEV